MKRERQSTSVGGVESKEQVLLNKYIELFNDAVSKRDSEMPNARIERREQLYNGITTIRSRKTGAAVSKLYPTYRNICFELVETQVNNLYPMPNIIPRDANKIDLARITEGYIKTEMERVDAEAINDTAERDNLKQGNTWYFVGWDILDTTPITQGELILKHYPTRDVYPQPGVSRVKDMEYIFVKDLVSIRKLKHVYTELKDKEIVEHPGFKGMCMVITCYYLSDKGYLSRLGFIENTDVLVFHDEDYELRRFRKCKRCGERVAEAEICPKCEYTEFEYVSDEYEVLTEDIIKIEVNDDGTQNEVILARKGSEIPYYSIRRLPFVCRKNISKNNSIFGVSDLDLLETIQESLNLQHRKMEEDITKAGAVIGLPAGTDFVLDDESLKIIKWRTPADSKQFTFNTFQANVQQNDIFQLRLYEFGRSQLGITDSFQGKRDPTAESGKAKEIAAARAAGRMESKRRMKEASYAEIYELMFKFLLAYCDEPRTYSRQMPDGKYVEAKFNRYNFLDEKDGKLYYYDRFIFGVDNASLLSTDRESMWQETTRNLQVGTFGNPTETGTLLLYWNTMDALGYPLAKQALISIEQRSQLLPEMLQKAIVSDPEIYKAVQTTIASIMQNREGGTSDVQNPKQ